MQVREGLLRPTLQITFFSFIGIIISLVAQLVIAYYYGATYERDAYFAAVVIPTYLAAIFTGSIGYIFLPKVIEIEKEGNALALRQFISTAFLLILVIQVFVASVVIIFSVKIIQITASGFSINQTILTARLLSIIIFTCLFSTLSNFLSSLYQIQHRFVKPAIAPLITSLTSIAFVILFHSRWGIYSLAAGFIVGSFLAFMFLIPILGHYHLTWKINLKNNYLISLVMMSLPLLLSGIIFRSTTVFERMIASGLPEGSISFLGYTNQIILILASLTSSGIAVSIYPLLSKIRIDRNHFELSRVFTKGIRIILIITIPTSLLIIFWGDLFIRVIFERGSFTHDVTLAVSRALIFTTGAFIFQSLGNIISRMFYLSGKTIAISIIGLIEIGIYITLGSILSKYLSFIGLSIALSISSGINTMLSLIFINKHITKFKTKIILSDTLKILLSSIISVSLIYLMYEYFNNGSVNLVYFIFCLIMGFISFIILGTLLSIDEIIDLKNLIHNKLVKIWSKK